MLEMKTAESANSIVPYEEAHNKLPYLDPDCLSASL